MIKNYTNVIKALVSECRNWPQIIFAKIFDLELKNIILNDGTRIYMGGKIGKADLSMFVEIWHSKFYNPDVFEIHKNDTVFDIGANNGYFTSYAAKKAIEGKIYAFEPVPDLANKIKKTVALNNFTNVIVESIALGDTNSNRPLYVSKEHNGCHSLYERKGEMEEINVPVKTLEKYCEDKNIQKIDFLKMDCEGAEYEIIKESSSDFIKNKINLISMECHDDINTHTHEEIVKVLQNTGFTVKVSNGYLYAKNEN